jgi:hypothetical protein
MVKDAHDKIHNNPNQRKTDQNTGRTALAKRFSGPDEETRADDSCEMLSDQLELGDIYRVVDTYRRSRSSVGAASAACA